MNQLLLYLLLVLLMILFAHMLDSDKRIKVKKENFNGGGNGGGGNGGGGNGDGSNDGGANKYIGSVIRLKVNLPQLDINLPQLDINLPQLDISTTSEEKALETNNKIFYLAFVKLNPNCSVINVNKSCVSVFVDDIKCNNNGLSIESNKNTYRLVLLHESQINKPDLSDTCNFVFEKVNDKIYLKNIQNEGYYPKLFTNNVYATVIGTSSNININNNILCSNSANVNGKNGITNNTTIGTHNLDGNTYLLSTTDNKTSSPVKLTFKKVDNKVNGNVDNKVNGNVDTNDVITIQLEKYDQYGQVYDYYDLIYTNKTETSSIYTVNTVSIDNYIKRLYPSNTLQFTPEIITQSPEFIKSNYVKKV